MPKCEGKHKPNYTLKDSERSPFGLGWEHRRRGMSLEHNPFEVGSANHEKYMEGWKKFQKPKFFKE